MTDSAQFKPRLKIIREAGDEQLMLLGDKPFTVGRRSDNELKVNDRHVSRYHARFSPDGGRWLGEQPMDSATARLTVGPAPRD